jgi:CHAT domain-containing protein
MIPESIQNPTKESKINDWLLKIEKHATEIQNAYPPKLSEDLSHYRADLLTLYLEMGNIALTFFQAPTEAQQLFQQGINYLISFIEKGESDYRVRKTGLKLFFNAAINAHRSLNNTKEAQTLYQRGLYYAQTFINEGEKAISVHEWALKLFFNAGCHAQQSDASQAKQLYKRGIEYAEQFLLEKTNEINKQHWSEFGEAMLKLYYNAGLTQLPKQIEVALRFWQRGLTHAKHFLPLEDTSSELSQAILLLYNNKLAALGHNQQIALISSALPDFAWWTWITWSKLSTSLQNEIWQNWHKHLHTLNSLSSTDTLTKHFQTLFSKVIINYDPQQNQQPILSTEILLNLSEIMYGITQIQETQRFHTVYHSLQQLQTAPVVQEADALPQRQQQLEQKLLVQWQQLGLQPFALDDLAALRKLSWGQKIWQHTNISQLRKTVATYQRLPQPINLARRPEWKHSLNQTKESLLDWLYNAFVKQLTLPEALEDAAAIFLALLLVSSSPKSYPDDEGELEPEKILSAWQQIPPWSNADALKFLLTESNWQTWLKTPQAPLSFWMNSLMQYSVAQRLTIVESQIKTPQPQLQSWLHDLSKGETTALEEILKETWQTAQLQAQYLAKALTFFLTPEEKATVELQALTAVILGDALSLLKQRMRNWLFPWDSPLNNEKNFLESKLDSETQEPPTKNKTFDEYHYSFSFDGKEWGEKMPDISEIVHHLTNSFTRALAIYTPAHVTLAHRVHHFAQLRLAELLTNEKNEKNEKNQKNQKEAKKVEQIWDLLERARIGLIPVNLALVPHWQETLNKELQLALEKSLDSLKNKQKSSNDVWPPLAVWLQQFSAMMPKPPTITTCQHHLQPFEALVQIFIDPIHRRLRALWLDKQNLSLYDFPDAGGHHRFWSNPAPQKRGLLDYWEESLTDWKQRYQQGEGTKIITQGLHWNTVINSVHLQVINNCLNRWANQQAIEQITIIFPASLGQLPWETLATLEPLLVREISVTHWLNNAITAKKEHQTRSPRSAVLKAQEAFSFKTQTPVSEVWIANDRSANTKCMNKEAQWVAQFFQTLSVPSPISSCPSALETLQRLAQSTYIHLNLLANYNYHQPQMILAEKQRHYLPLWLYPLHPISAELIVLAASESHINGKEAEKLLTTSGIGPTLAAAGAKTVVGSLWPPHSLAALCFSYHFYQIANQYPNLPWHQVLAQARQTLRKMTTTDLKNLTNKIKEDDSKDTCHYLIHRYQKAEITGQKPFAHPFFWAGFVVLGKVQR